MFTCRPPRSTCCGCDGRKHHQNFFSFEVLAHFPRGLDLRDSELKFAETLDASGRGGGITR